MKKKGKSVKAQGVNTEKSKKVFNILGCTGMIRRDLWEPSTAFSLGGFLPHLEKGPVAVKNSDKVIIYYRLNRQTQKIVLTGDLIDSKKFLSGNLEFKEIPK